MAGRSDGFRDRPGTQANRAPETQDGQSQAPKYCIPSRKLAAVEHPMIVRDVENALKTFGDSASFRAVVESGQPQDSLPLWLRYDNPSIRPLVSHNAASHNVVLKVTVPKRTGRKRKRGSDEPFHGDALPQDALAGHDHQEIASVEGRDEPLVLRKKLRDNVSRYQAEAVGIIEHTHRYRGLADFQYSLGRSHFVTRFVDDVLPGDVSKMRAFTFQPGLEQSTPTDLVPAPFMTPLGLPYHYHYSHNPFAPPPGNLNAEFGADLAGGDGIEDALRGVRDKSSAGYFIPYNKYPVPAKPKKQPNMSDPQVAALMRALNAAMEERHIWTRRGIINYLSDKNAIPESANVLKTSIQFAGYQFRGGPWRDALVKYGVDPRSDPKYRIYQTLAFKMQAKNGWGKDRMWHSKQDLVHDGGEDTQQSSQQTEGDVRKTTHMFNGKSYSTDGRIWQVCDVTDPVLARLFANAAIRPDCDIEVSGWYYRIPWMTAKSIMKMKMLAIRFGKEIQDSEFYEAIKVIDGSPGPVGFLQVPLPSLHLSPNELDELSMRSPVKAGKRASRRAKRRQGIFRMTFHSKVLRDAARSTTADGAETLATLEETVEDDGSPSRRLQGELPSHTGRLRTEANGQEALTALESLDEADDDEDEGSDYDSYGEDLDQEEEQLRRRESDERQSSEDDEDTDGAEKFDDGDEEEDEGGDGSEDEDEDEDEEEADPDEEDVEEGSEMDEPGAMGRP